MQLLEKVKEKLNENVKRLTVGPVPSHPGILELLGKQFFSTRDKFFVDIFKELQPFLQESVGTKINNVILEHGSGSSGLSCVGNHLLKPNDKVVCINSGKFGERWIEIVKKRKCQIIEISVDWRKSIDWNYVKDILLKEQPFALLMQHSETSTGAVHSLNNASICLKKYSPKTLFIVDAISSWGSIPVLMDENEIDAVVGCSQKGFMLPTGLHLISFSKKALNIISLNNKNGVISDYSHSPCEDVLEQLNGKPRFSMDSNSIMALIFLKEEIIDKIGGWDKWFNETKRRSQLIRESLNKLNLQLFSESSGDVVMAIELPKNYDIKDVRKKLLSYGFEVNNSQDEKKFYGIRIGNMGYITDNDIQNLIKALGLIFLQE